MRRDLDKVLAAQFLEAVKEVLRHLGQWQMELEERGRETPRRLRSVYGRVRRLRDYLQRSVAAYPSPVQLEMSKADENLLVSCAVHYLGVLDRQEPDPHAPDVAPQDVAWYEQRRRALAAGALAFASAPVERIPSPDAARLNTNTPREVVAAVLAKVKPAAAATRSKQPPSGRSGRPRRGDPGRSPRGPARPELAAEPASGPRQPPASTGGHPGSVAKPALTDPTGLSGVWRVEASSARSTSRDDTPGGGMVAPAEVARLVDPRRLSEPRLATILGLALSSYERAHAAHDHRCAMVHLASILEGVVVDCALARQAELGLDGEPASWDLQGVLVQLIGERFGAMDRAYMTQFHAIRDLTRPAVQLLSPIVVTPSSLDQAVTFVRRVLAELGYTAEERPAPDGADAGALFQAAVAASLTQ